VAPFKHAVLQSQIDWSNGLESMRKDVECTFGIMKRRFRILAFGIRVQGLDFVDDIWHTCCAMHNWLLREDGLDQGWEETWTTAQVAEVDEDLLRATPGLTNAMLSFDSNLTEQERDDDYITRRDALVEHYAFKKANKLLSWPARTGQ